MSRELRRATEADLDPIMEIETGTFANDAWSRDAMLSDLRNPQCYYLVVDRPGVAGALDGYAGLFAPQGADQGDIQTIAVVETARRGGLGRSLMQSLIAEARQRGAREVLLEVRADNPGPRKLYESLGFEEIAVRVRYYQPDSVDAIVMRLTVPEPQPRSRPAVGQ